MVESRPILVYSEIRVRRLPRALRFYRALGLRPVAKGTMKDGTELVWVQDPRTRQLLELYRVPSGSPLYKPIPRVRRPDPQLVFSVRGITPLLRRLRRLGAQVTEDFEEGECRLLFVRDPEGNCLELVGWTDAARRAHRSPPLLRLVRPSRRGAPRRR